METDTWERRLTMVSSISSSESDIQQMMALMLQQMGSANTDGISGLSKTELSSIDASGDIGGSAFLKSLTEQFDSLDTDGSGQLSSEEISKAMPPKGAMGPPPGLPIDSDGDGDLMDAINSPKDAKKTESTNSTSATDTSSSGSSLSDAIEQLISSLLESFSESFDKSSSSTSNEAAAQEAAKSVTSVADSDGNGAVSLNELSSIDSSAISDLSNQLSRNFKTYDTNNDGELSAEEMKAAMQKPDKQFSMRELAAMSSNDSSNSYGDLLGGSSSNFVQKLISGYQNSGLSNIASSISLVS